jgi:hypothetical protein
METNNTFNIEINYDMAMELLDGESCAISEGISAIHIIILRKIEETFPNLAKEYNYVYRNLEE